MLLLTLNFVADAHAAMDTRSDTDTETALHAHMDENDGHKSHHSSPQDCQHSICHSFLLTSQTAMRIQVASNLKFCFAPVCGAGALFSPPDRPPRTIL